MFYLTKLMDKGRDLLCIWEKQEEKVVLKYFYYPAMAEQICVEKGIRITDTIVYNMHMQAEKRGFEGCIAPTCSIDSLHPYVIETSEDYDTLLGEVSLMTLSE